MYTCSCIAIVVSIEEEGSTGRLFERLFRSAQVLLRCSIEHKDVFRLYPFLLYA